MVLAEDAMSCQVLECHQFSVKHIFPRLGRVRSTAQVLQALTAEKGGSESLSA